MPIASKISTAAASIVDGSIVNDDINSSAAIDWSKISKTGAVPYDISALGILATVTGINGKSATTTTLYTVPTGRTAVITQVVVRPTSVNTVTTGPTLGVGVAAGEVDILASLNLAALVATGKVAIGVPIAINAVTAAAGSVIKLGITVAAVATTYTMAVALIGYTF